MSKPPSTDHEWIIHSINIHGVFFERWCQKTISEKVIGRFDQLTTQLNILHPTDFCVVRKVHWIYVLS